MQLRHLALLFALALPMAVNAQTDITCHVTPFEGTGSSGLSGLSAAMSINRYGNVVGNYFPLVDGQISGQPYIRYRNGAVRKLNVSIANTQFIEPLKRNASGVTVGRYQTNTDPIEAGGFIHHRKTTKLFRFPGATYTSLTGINMYGTLVGNYYGDANGRDGIFKVKDGVITRISVPHRFSRNTQVSAISDTGVIVGTYDVPDSPPPPGQTTHGFVYANGKWEDFAYPHRTNTYIKDINAIGEIVGVLDNNDPDSTFVYKNGRFYHPIFVLPDGTSRSSYTSIFGVNGYGEISGLIPSDGDYRPFVGNCNFGADGNPEVWKDLNGAR